MQYRIGDRDPATGLYDVIHPDGSATRNGIKIFNSAHEFGDVVLATERSDGMMILDGVKATLTEVVTTSFGLGGFGEKPVGYLAGQVFNNEEEVILPIASIDFAPGSPTELEPGAGDFVVRIKIDRPQNTDLRVKLELSGTAASGDYTVVGLDGDSIAIVPAGELYFDVAITPTQNSLNLPETAILKLLQDREYRIGQDNIVTATILVPLPLQLSIDFAPNSPTQVKRGNGAFSVRISANAVQSANLYVFFSLGGTADYGSDYLTSSSNIAVILSAGQAFIDLIITPQTDNIYNPNQNIITLSLVTAWVGYTQYGFSNNTLTMTILPRQFVSRFYTRYTDVTFNLVTSLRPDLFSQPGFTVYFDRPVNVVKTPGAWSVETFSVDEGSANFDDYNSYWNTSVAIDVYDNVARYIDYISFNLPGSSVINRDIDISNGGTLSNGLIGVLASGVSVPPVAPPKSLEVLLYNDPLDLVSPGSVNFLSAQNSNPRDINYFTTARFYNFSPGLFNQRPNGSPLVPAVRNPPLNSLNVLYDACREFEYV
jgi:hypothetical protein